MRIEFGIMFDCLIWFALCNAVLVFASLNLEIDEGAIVGREREEYEKISGKLISKYIIDVG